MRTRAKWPSRALATAPWKVLLTHRASCAALVLSTVSALTTGVAAQQPAAGADEMRSMYCVEVIRAEIDLQHHMISASDDAANSATTPALRQQWIDTSSELLQGLAKLEALRYRLQAYMLPRMHGLDSFALAAAIREGDADFEASRAVADRCAAECATPQLTNGPQACSASCGDSGALTRVSACQNPTWLPAERGSTPGDTRR
jgi:hypothetical protein